MKAILSSCHQCVCPDQNDIIDLLLRGFHRGGGGGPPYITYRVCAAQRGRDFEAPDLERVSISEAFSRTGYKK